MSSTFHFIRSAARALLVLFLLSPPLAWGATRVDLNGAWQFRLDPQKQGEQQAWSAKLPGDTETVRVPHTWNIGKYDDFEGTAWYFRSFQVPDELRAKHVELHFGATFYRSRVWLNGVELGAHDGGHTAYFFDVTPHLQRVNFLAVEINNQPTKESIPGWALKLHSSENVWYDWWHYGGIVRDVWLTVNEPQLIRRQEIRTRVDGQSASINDRIFLESFARKAAPVKLMAKAYAPSGGPAVATAEQTLTLSPGKQDATVTMKIEPVLLWHFDQPNVYRMEVTLLDAKSNELDSLTDTFGARTIEIRDRKLYLNGESVRLTGMARHEESPAEGLAETAGTILYDYNDMKVLQMTLTRPVHYPQHPAILDYCDRHGILLIPEIPLWQFSGEQMSDPKVITLAKQMMEELIQQDFNHPSVFAWSTCNESATNTAGGRAYFQTMYDFIKRLDPDRFVTFADDQIAFTDNPQDNASSMADFIMWNEYFGAWHGPTSLLPAIFEKIQRDYPNKMVIVSEFGTPGPFAPNTRLADKLRSGIFREQLEAIGKQPWIAGALMWCYQDYKSHRNLWPGYTAGIVDHGVVDENRQRRPSYEVWKELNSPAHLSLEWVFDRDRRPTGFRATIERRRADEIPSYTLRGYQAVFEVRDNDNNKVAGSTMSLPDIGPAQSVADNWQPTASKSLKLTLRLIRPTGFIATEKVLDWWEPRTGGMTIEEMKHEGIPAPQ